MELNKKVPFSFIPTPIISTYSSKLNMRLGTSLVIQW